MAHVITPLRGILNVKTHKVMSVNGNCVITNLNFVVWDETNCELFAIEVNKSRVCGR